MTELLPGLPDVPGSATLLDRELSQLQFNARVLALAEDHELPLLERIKFCAIAATNTDEFVQKRMAILKQQAVSGAHGDSWLTSAQQLDAVRDALRGFATRQGDLLGSELGPAMAKEGIGLTTWDALDDAERGWCDTFFAKQMFPVLTPLAIDPGRPFPHISSLSINLAVAVRLPSGESSFARVKVPPFNGRRFLQLPARDDGSVRFLPAEEIVAAHLPDLFPDVEVTDHWVFRVTRNADQLFDEEEAEDLLETISSGLLRRRFGEVERLEVDAHIEPSVLERFLDELGCDHGDVVPVEGLLNLGDLWDLYRLDRPDLKDTPWAAVTPRAFAAGVGRDDRGRRRTRRDLFEVIRQGDVLVHHPYESFDTTVEDFIELAADDPKVVAIKLTIYRTSAQENQIVDALVRAAESGKQTVALVELKARFDEETNIRRARRLERAGVHVVYGLIGLKTHTKTCLVVRSEGAGLRRYAHIGTGNYNATTAKIYEDLGVLTCDPQIGADLSELFNMLTGYSRGDRYAKLLVAPVAMRRRLLELVDRERAAGPDGLITIKCNNLVDRPLIEALYAASQAGCPVQLIVRSMCALRPGLPGLSEQITVRSIVGRFLEHSRVFRFGTPERGQDYLIGSADMMTRNLDHRVEAIVPITDETGRARLEEVLRLLLADNRLAWELLEDGHWARVADRVAPGTTVVDTHAALMERAVARR